jgi:hypothetical protein
VRMRGDDRRTRPASVIDGIAQSELDRNEAA